MWRRGGTCVSLVVYVVGTEHFLKKLMVEPLRRPRRETGGVRGELHVGDGGVRARAVDAAGPCDGVGSCVTLYRSVPLPLRIHSRTLPLRKH